MGLKKCVSALHGTAGDAGIAYAAAGTASEGLAVPTRQGYFMEWASLRFSIRLYCYQTFGVFTQCITTLVA